jgi:aspartate/glutamate racemase
MAPPAPRIALIHAVYPAMAPAAAAFAALWPEAHCVNLVDDALPADLEADGGGLTPQMDARIARLAQHAIAAGAQGVLFTCSAFGGAIEKAAAVASVPVLKPNEAMFEAALGAGQRIGMLGTFAPAMVSMEAEFLEMAAARGLRTALVGHCVPQAMASARAGDIATHNGLLAAAAPHLAGCDLVMLAHFSTSTATAAVQAVLGCPVISAPAAAVAALKRLTGSKR